MIRWLTIFSIAAPALSSGLQPVQKLNFTGAKSSEIRIAWSAPSTTYQESIQGYRICAAPLNGAPKCIGIQNAKKVGHAVQNLQACEKYNISVVAIGKDESTSEAAHILASTGPGPASGLAVVRNGKGTISATWSYETSAARGCAEMFKLTWCRGKGTLSDCTVARIPFMTTATTYSQQLHYVQYCGSYTVRLSVLDHEQRSSDQLEATLDEHPIAGPENLRVSNYTSSSIIVQWDIPESQLNCDYRVFVDVVFTERSSRKSVETIFDAGRTSYSINDAAPCKAYNVTVGFETSTENKNASVVAYTLPKGDEILSNASIENQTSSSVSVVWTTLPENRECVTAYSVCWGKNYTVDSCQDTTDENFRIAGLEPATNYQVSVEARLGNGSPLASRKLEAFTTSGAGAVPHCTIVIISTAALCLITT